MESHNYPQSLITHFLLHLPFYEPTFSNLFKTSRPEITFPKTVCFPLRCGAFLNNKKNYDPFVFGPALAMERSPRLTCLTLKFSSLNFSP